MANYVPQNVNVFQNALAAAMAGMGINGGNPTDPVSADYVSLANVAGAFAQSFDTTWGATVPDSFQLEAILQICGSYWDTRGVSPQTAPFLTPATYNSISAAIKAMVLAGETYLNGQSIVPLGLSRTAHAWAQTVGDVAVSAALAIALSKSITPISTGKIAVRVTGVVQNTDSAAIKSFTVGITTGTVGTGTARYSQLAQQIEVGSGGNPEGEAFCVNCQLDQLAAPFIALLGVPVQINATVIGSATGVVVPSGGLQLDLQEMNT